MKHALLSASGAHRWLICTPSARLEETLEETESVYADEGTLAHKIAEHLIKEKLYNIDMSHLINPLKKHELYSDEMLDYVTEYAEFVAERVRSAPKGSILIQESRVHYSEFVPGGFGHVDVGIVGPGVLGIIDYKHGKGVPVDAFENEQLMIYALGFILDYDMVYDIEEVSITIYQPRINNISTYIINKDQLLRWAHEVLAPTAKIAYAGLGEYIPGDHCRFCRAKPTCAAHAKLNLMLARKEFEIAELTDEQIIRIYNKADAIKNWMTSIETHVLQQALKGKKWPGMKVVAGRSVRKYTNEKAILDNLETAGFDKDDLVKTKLIGITDLTKKVGKEVFKNLVEPFVHKPPGAPTIVPDTDKRAEWNANEVAKLEFGDDVAE